MAKQLTYYTANYTKDDVVKQRRRAEETRRQLTRESIRATLYCTSYGKLNAEKTLQEHNNSIKQAHELWKIKNEVK